ncbi:MAG: cytochrome P450 [Chloroflexota bacterium]
MVNAPTAVTLPDPPGPSGVPLIGMMPRFLRNPLRVINQTWREYGDIVRYRYLLEFWGYMIFRPEHVKRVLQDNNHNYPKAPRQMTRFSEVMGNGLFTSGGDEWLLQRRTMQPAFHRQGIQGFATIMTSETESLVERWGPLAQSHQPFDIMPETRRLVMKIVARSLFGAELGAEVDEIGRSMPILLEWTNRRLYYPIDPIGDLPLPPRRAFESHLAIIERHVMHFIADRRASTEHRPDLLTMLLEARDPETGRGLTDTELRDQVMTIFLAGTDTTVNLLGWTWYLLSKHPECARQLQAELATVLAGRRPTADDVPRLRYTSMVLDEVLRLYPPAWATTRMATGDDETGGYRIRAGESILMSQWITHRHPEFWENPEGFDPERFSPERSAGRPRFAYFPFGGGPRQCIGNTFALMEAQLVVATVLQRFHVDLVPGATVRPKPVIGLRPDPGVMVRLRAIR